jgi:hypothetical protein
MVEIVSDMMPYIILRGHRCHIIVLNVHAPTQDKINDVKDSFYKEQERLFDKFPKYHTKILLGDFNAKVGREDIFKTTIWNERLNEISNDDGVRVLNFPQSTMFPNRNIYKCTWTSPDEKTHNLIDHILIGRQRHSSVLDIRSFSTADCDTDHSLLVAKVRERLAENKQRLHRFHKERFNLKN